MIDMKKVEVVFGGMVDIQICGAIYEEANDTELTQPVKLQEDRTLRTYSIFVGNSGGEEATVALDAAQKLRTREFEPYAFVAPDDIPNADTNIYTVPADTYAVVEIEAVPSGVNGAMTLYVRPNGVAAGAANIIANAVALNASTIGFRLGPYVMNAGGIITANANPANSGTVHVYAREYGTGDAVDY